MSPVQMCEIHFLKKMLMLLGSLQTWVYVAWYHEKKYPCYPGWLCFPGGIMPVPVVSSGHWSHSVPWKITMFQGGTSSTAVKIFHICWLTFTSWWPRFLLIPHGQVWRPTKMPQNFTSMWKTYGFPVHKCYTNGGSIPHWTVSLQQIRRGFGYPFELNPIKCGKPKLVMLRTPRKNPWDSTRFPSLAVSAIFQALVFVGCILILASSCFKLFVHFGPSNDALSIGRSCWFWPDGAHCRLESLLMVMTHRCLNPIVLGRVGWWVKAWFSSWWFSATALGWVEANCGTLWILKTTLCILWGREFSSSNLMAPDCLRRR